MPFTAKHGARLGRLLPCSVLSVAKVIYWRSLSDRKKRAQIASAFSAQADWCERLGSPLYAHLMRRAARDIERVGPTWTVLRDVAPAPVGADHAIPLRLMAGVHRLVLKGEAPGLARHYLAAADGTTQGVWPAFIGVVSEQISELRGAMHRPVQTNEPGRSAALLGGFLLAGRATAGRLRLLEPGASAGLNLRWDMFRYEAGKAAWGDPQSPVQLRNFFIGGDPPLHLPARVVERAGCDLNPLDPHLEEDRLTLRSLVWPDQQARMAVLDAALDLAQRTPVQVDRADAAEWLATQLDRTVPGVTTVVFHSFFEQYPGDATRARLRSLLKDAASRATEDAPLAYLRMEWGHDGADIELTTWPSPRYREALIATADNQGRNIRWLGGAGG